MSAINGIKAKNLRSLIDTGELSIKKINLLVGRNSGGKSTFARILPLIRQSTEVRKKSPVLWYGRLVDFGSFHDSVRDSDSNNKIQLSFRIAFDKKNIVTVNTLKQTLKTYDILVSITLTDENKSTDTIVSKLEIDFEKVKCELNFENGKLVSIKVGDLLEIVNPAIYQSLTFTGLLPNINSFKYEKVIVGNQSIHVPMKADIFIGPLQREILGMAKIGTTSESIESFIKKLSYGTDKEILIQLQSNSDGPAKWTSFCKNLQEKSITFEKIRNSVLMANLPELIESLDETISALAKNVSYLEPLRATAQRYYRRQELAVDELDSRGENLPFFLDNLADYEKKELDNWLKKSFGISIETESSGGHIAIRLKIAGSKKAVNLADAGFGYSQVLPIALQLWKLTQGSMFSRRAAETHDQRIVVMEQPELHLHPALQSKLADIFAACISEEAEHEIYKRQDLRIIIETHSPSLINRIGELVALGKIKSSQVQVILFDKDEETGTTTTRVSEYNEEGQLENWPYGFFDAVDDIDIDLEE